MTQAKNDRVLGTLHPDGDSGSVRVQDTYDTGMDDLWSALTEPDRLARWIGTVDGELRLGGEFRAAFFTSGWEGVGRVRECDPPPHFRIEPTDADGSGAGAIDVSLTPDGDRTILVIVESGIPVAAGGIRRGCADARRRPGCACCRPRTCSGATALARIDTALRGAVAFTGLGRHPAEVR